MALSKKDKKAVEAAAKAGGLKDVKVSSSGNVSASNSKASSSTPAPTPVVSQPTVKASTPTVTKTTTTGSTTPIATMGTVAKDPKTNVQPVNTSIPTNQAANTFGSTSAPVSPTAYKTGTVKTDAPNYIGGLMGGLIDAGKAVVKAATTPAFGSQPSQPANVYGNTQAAVSPFNIGKQSTAPVQSTPVPINQTPAPTAKGTQSSYSGGSIVDYLNSIGKPSDFNSRAILAAQNGILNYSGTAEQNSQLLNKLRGGAGSVGITTSSTGGGYTNENVSTTGGTSTGFGTTPTGTTGMTTASTPTRTTDTTSYGIDKKTGLPVGPGNDPRGSAPVTATGTTASTPSPYTAPNGGLYGQLIADQANRSKSSSEYDQAAKDYQKALKDYNSLKQKMNEQLAATDQEAIPLTFQQGRKQILNQLYAQQLADAAARVTQAQQGMQYATSQYGAETQALQGALGAAGAVLQGGQYMPFGGDGASMQAGIAKATQWAIAQQNMAQGANYQGQAQELSNALQAMQPLGQKLTSFMTQAGLNPATAPLINQQIKTMDAQLYPDAVATMNAAVNDIRSYAIQILGSQSGANPSDVTAAVSSFDFGDFTPLQLQTLFKNLENMGMVRLGQAQSASQAGYNANLTGGGAAAQGMTAQDMGAFDTGGKISSSDVNNTLKAFGGVGLNVGQSLGGMTGMAARVLGL